MKASLRAIFEEPPNKSRKLTGMSLLFIRETWVMVSVSSGSLAPALGVPANSVG